MLRFILCSLAVAGLFPLDAQLARDWRSVASPHFEMLSRYDVSRTRTLLTELEWAKTVLDAAGLKTNAEGKALILVPDSPFDYEQISPSKYSAGYYMGAPSRDIIVLRDLFTQPRFALIHEYLHLLLHHEGVRWPAWFNEGTAEFYSTMRAVKNGVEIGAPNPERVAVFKKGAWAPVSYVVSLNSSLGLTSQEAGWRFYAQSWLYVHMLQLAPAYRGGFAAFRKLIAAGVASEEALRRTYSKSLNQFDEDARTWLRSAHLPTEIMQAPAAPAPEIQDRIVTALDGEIARLTIALSVRKQPDISKEFSRLSRQAEGRCDLQAPLGDLATAADLRREARLHYDAAVRCGGKLPPPQEPAKPRPATAVTVVTEAKPEPPPAAVTGRLYYNLGRSRYFENDFEGALREFESASGLPQPEHFQMTRLKALALAKAGRFAEADSPAQTLAGMARDPHQHNDARLTAGDVRRERELSQPPPPDPTKIELPLLGSFHRLEGEVVRVDCVGDRAIFSVHSGTETRKFIVQPGEVVTPSGTNLTFGCGPQKRPVVLGYQEQKDAPGIFGRVRYIEFR